MGEDGMGASLMDLLYGKARTLEKFRSLAR